MAIKIIDYKAGNAPSVLHATNRLGYAAEFASHPQDLADATHIILPGVGSAQATMDSLREQGLITALEDAVLHRDVFFLGICVGMQILFQHSEEDDADCLGWLKGQVVKFDASQVRVPQMGWNEVRFVKEGVLDNVTDDASGNARGDSARDFFYFVNSYFARPVDKSDIWGIAEYGDPFTAAVCRDNIFATQFHLEKSGEAGLALLDRFLSLTKEETPC
ncbi:MAG: imidazole glycerol phosphate synthase subunit HisH [Coriobacteriia bacterium]|nr:imidazole glycerol phosphate synthase subunit HisH [Coriobacteriia bacterium]